MSTLTAFASTSHLSRRGLIDVKSNPLGERKFLAEIDRTRDTAHVALPHVRACLAPTSGFGRSLSKEDEVVVEATGNAMAVVRVLSPYAARVIVANPLQVKAIPRGQWGQRGARKCRRRTP
jgi:hypothetical protein